MVNVKNNKSGQKLVLTLDLPASVNSIYGINPNGGIYLKPVGKKYKKDMIKLIKTEAKKQGWVKIVGRFLYMDEVVYMNQKGRDSDNLKKLQQDSITESGAIWEDDSWCLPRTERIIIDKYNPRIELTITVAPFIGIFDNKDQCVQFESKCKGCKRYKNNCSILRQSKEGRVTPNVDKDLNCDKYNPID